MITRKNGIIIDIHFIKKKNKVINQRSFIAENRYNEYVELMRGYEETVIVPFDSIDYKKSIKEGYVTELSRWKNDKRKEEI